MRLLVLLSVLSVYSSAHHGELIGSSSDFNATSDEQQHVILHTVIMTVQSS